MQGAPRQDSAQGDGRMDAASDGPREHAHGPHLVVPWRRLERSSVLSRLCPKDQHMYITPRIGEWEKGRRTGINIQSVEGFRAARYCARPGRY